MSQSQSQDHRAEARLPSMLILKTVHKKQALSPIPMSNLFFLDISHSNNNLFPFRDIRIFAKREGIPNR